MTPARLGLLLLADDAVELRHLRRRIELAAGEGAAIVGVGTPRGVESLAREPSIDVVLADLSGSTADALDVVGRLRAIMHGPPVVVLAVAPGDEHAFALIRAGAQDVIAKHTADATTLIRALRAAVCRHGARRGVDPDREIKSRFLAHMSHELRTPLNSIIGFSELLLSGAGGSLSDQQAAYVGDIARSGEMLLGMVDDVLDLSGAESGRIELVEEDLSLAGVLDACARMLVDRAAKTRVVIDVDVAPGLPALRADRRKVTQGLLNILANAVALSPSGGRVLVEAGLQGDGSLMVRVSDGGGDGALVDASLALEPFAAMAANPFVARAQPGLDLGLPLTKALIELHGGTLHLASRKGFGTAVTMRFPSARLVDAQAGGIE